MKWLSIFHAATRGRFSAFMRRQTELPRGDVSTAAAYNGSEQPARWVTVQTDDMGNTILVSFRSV
ncbi:hypothetical protein, partial [Bradyrhizobium liaoningense]|uniref:hypothetical protein n=1 Tax=Bradyrhizobium liaoningense TaxID=43992 RepID=UPI001BA7203E